MRRRRSSRGGGLSQAHTRLGGAMLLGLPANGAAIARSGALAFRLLFVGADPASPGTEEYVSPGPGVLRLRDVTLTGGLAQGGASIEGGGGAGMGGAIFSQGTVIIERSTQSATARAPCSPSGSTAPRQS